MSYAVRTTHANDNVLSTPAQCWYFRNLELSIEQLSLKLIYLIQMKTKSIRESGKVVQGRVLEFADSYGIHYTTAKTAFVYGYSAL